MHIEASWYVKGAVAILEGPYMMPTSNCKMTFYYHMSGPDTGSLTIFVNSGDEMKVILNMTGHQADNWIKAEATVKSDYAFRIHITATRGDGYQGDIAIDDIKFQVQSRCIIIIIIMIAIIINSNRGKVLLIDLYNKPTTTHPGIGRCLFLRVQTHGTLL